MKIYLYLHNKFVNCNIVENVVFIYSYLGASADLWTVIFEKAIAKIVAMVAAGEVHPSGMIVLWISVPKKKNGSSSELSDCCTQSWHLNTRMYTASSMPILIVSLKYYEWQKLLQSAGKKTDANGNLAGWL